MKKDKYLFANEEEYVFVLCPIWIDWITYKKGRTEKKQLSLIGVKNTKTNLEIIHPISEFILENYVTHRYLTQRKYG